MLRVRGGLEPRRGIGRAGRSSDVNNDQPTQEVAQVVRQSEQLWSYLVVREAVAGYIVWGQVTRDRFKNFEAILQLVILTRIRSINFAEVPSHYKHSP